jgi:hypothetical protein
MTPFFRKFFVSALAGLMFVTAFAPVGFAQTEWWHMFTYELFTRGIIDAPDARFRPEAFVNRAEFASMINRAAKFADNSADVIRPNFLDVNTSDWFYIPVAALENLGIVKGTAGIFSPEQNVTRAEAVKMIVLAFDLHSNIPSTGFTDIQTTDWYYGFATMAQSLGIIQGINNEGRFAPNEPLTRAAAAKLITLALHISEPEETETVAEEDLTETEDVPETVDEILQLEPLQVGVAASSPNSTIIPRNAFNTDFVHLSFYNSNTVPLEIRNLIITRSGLGPPNNFSSVRLLVGRDQYGSDRTFTNKSIATFLLERQPIVVAPGVTTIVRVVGDLNDLGSGYSHILGIRSASDVLVIAPSTGNQVRVVGDFPLNSGSTAVAQAESSEASFRVIDPNGSVANTYGLRATNQLFGQIILSAGTEDIELNSVTFRNIGSAQGADLADLELYSNRRRIAGPIQMNERIITFQFSGEPLYIRQGTDVTLELRGDIAGGFEKTIGFDVQNDWDIQAVSVVNNRPVRVMRSSSSQPIIPDLIR